MHKILRETNSGFYIEHVLSFFKKNAGPKDFVASVKTGFVSSGLHPFQTIVVIWLHPSVFPTLMPIIESIFSDQVCQGVYLLEWVFIILVVIVVECIDSVRRLEIWGGKSFSLLSTLFPQLADDNLAFAQNGTAFCLDTFHPEHSKNVTQTTAFEKGEMDVDAQETQETDRSNLLASGQLTTNYCSTLMIHVCALFAGACVEALLFSGQPVMPHAMHEANQLRQESNQHRYGQFCPDQKKCDENQSSDRHSRKHFHHRSRFVGESLPSVKCLVIYKKIQNIPCFSLCVPNSCLRPFWKELILKGLVGVVLDVISYNYQVVEWPAYRTGTMCFMFWTLCLSREMSSMSNLLWTPYTCLVDLILLSSARCNT